MNQTKKRLKIIKLAISITDIETIQLQILKLSVLKTDVKIQEIIHGLQAENYAQTQALITLYIETPTEEILQRSSQEERQIIEEQEKDFFDFNILTSEEISRQEQETVDFDALLNIEADDILSDNINLDSSHTPKDTFFDLLEQDARTIEENHTDATSIAKDTFFDREEALTTLFEKYSKEAIQEKFVTTSSEENMPLRYKVIPYIDQKFKNLYIQYPPVQESNEEFSTVNAWLLQINNDGYTDDEVEEMIEYITKLTETNNLAEAAQLLLISGATKSKFAQFMLARALYTGKVLQKNLPESFTLINRLAMNDDYPEAICDLAQFYEKGIGIDKDKKKAEALYKDAMDLGIKRALGHYERVRKQKNGLFSLFKK